VNLVMCIKYDFYINMLAIKSIKEVKRVIFKTQIKASE